MNEASLFKNVVFVDDKPEEVAGYILYFKDKGCAVKFFKNYESFTLYLATSSDEIDLVVLDIGIKAKADPDNKYGGFEIMRCVQEQNMSRARNPSNTKYVPVSFLTNWAESDYRSSMDAAEADAAEKSEDHPGDWRIWRKSAVDPEQFYNEVSTWYQSVTIIQEGSRDYGPAMYIVRALLRSGQLSDIVHYIAKYFKRRKKVVDLIRPKQ